MYVFIDTTYVLTYGLGAWGIAMQSRGRLVATTVSVGFLAVSVSIARGRQAQPAGGDRMRIVGALPGVALAVRRIGFRRILLPSGLILVAALRQIVVSILALVRHDPFMTYRQVSSGTQSVPLGTALQASIVGLIALLCVVLVGLLVRKSVPVALSAGIAVTWLILTKTSSSGARVRSRIGSGSTLTSTFWVSPPSCLPTMRDLLSQPGSGSSRNPDPRDQRSACSRPRGCGACRRIRALGPGRVGPATFHRARAGVQTQTPLLEASAHAAKHAHGVILPDPCIDPKLLTAESDAAVAFYNKGIAWPDNHRMIARLTSMNAGEEPLSLAVVSQSRIAAVLTWSECSAGWDRHEAASGARLLDSEPVSTGGKINLWAASLGK